MIISAYSPLAIKANILSIKIL